MSKRKTDVTYLQHILNFSNDIVDFTADTSKQEYYANVQLQDAIVRKLELIGEAANKISVPLQKRHDTVPWNKIIGMRHKLIHDYFDVDFGAVWKTATEDIPTLKSQIEKILSQLS